MRSCLIQNFEYMSDFVMTLVYLKRPCWDIEIDSSDYFHMYLTNMLDFKLTVILVSKLGSHVKINGVILDLHSLEEHLRVGYRCEKMIFLSNSFLSCHL